MKTYHYIIQGRVQGVAFRYYTQRTAYQLGIKGTVKNLYNGDVEIYAQGKHEAIVPFEAFLHQGPISARIERVIKEELEDDHEFTSFQIVY